MSDCHQPYALRAMLRSGGPRNADPPTCTERRVGLRSVARQTGAWLVGHKAGRDLPSSGLRSIFCFHASQHGHCDCKFLQEGVRLVIRVVCHEPPECSLCPGGGHTTFLQDLTGSTRGRALACARRCWRARARGVTACGGDTRAHQHGRECLRPVACSTPVTSPLSSS